MEERRRSYDARPESRLWETFVATAFLAHPYGQPIIGWMSDIDNLTRTKAEDFLHRHYAPNNAVMAIVGDIDANKARVLVEKYFGDIPPGVPLTPVTVEEPAQQGERRVEVIGDASPQVYLGFHKPALPHPDEYVFDVIDRVLADGRTSRLYKKLVVADKLATDIGAFTAPGDRYPNLFIIAATPRAPHTVAEVEAAIKEEIDLLKREPVTEHELDQIRNNLEYEEVVRMGSNGGLARSLTESEAIAGTWRYLIEHRRRVAGVTPEDVRRVAVKYLTNENCTVGFLTKRPVAP